MVPAIYLFDRFDSPLGILPAVASLAHTEELGGEDTIEFDCAAAPEKGSRLLWRDPEDGAWREHVVVRTDEPEAGAAHVYAESSVCELLGDFIEEERLSAKTAAEALAAVLAHMSICPAEHHRLSRFSTGSIANRHRPRHGSAPRPAPAQEL